MREGQAVQYGQIILGKEQRARLLNLDNRARAQFGPGPLGQFKQNWSVARLEERFAKEETMA